MAGDENGGNGGHDVFLCYNERDHEAVVAVARRLQAEGVEPWLDLWDVIPGRLKNEAIGNALERCPTCVVFAGPEGSSPWQNAQIQAAIERRSKGTDFGLIQVQLPGAGPEPLHFFLDDHLAVVDLREGLDDESEFHRLLCGIRGLKPRPGPLDSGKFDARHCPYRGLELFDVEHEPFFFGRQVALDLLFNDLRQRPGAGPQRFLAIVGPSGSGKSSLTRAGLLAGLRAGRIPGSETWLQTIVRPGAHPLEELADMLTLSPEIRAVVDGTQQLQDQLGHDPHALHRVVRRALHDAPSRRLVLLVDPLEELFSVAAEKARKPFLDNLHDAATRGNGQTVVVLTLRADFSGELAVHPDLQALVSSHHHALGMMGPKDLRHAIVAPMRKVGGEVEPGLVDLLLDDMVDQAGALPLLQHTLKQLWERCEDRRLSISAYKELGRIEGALDRTAEQVYRSLGDEEREVCRRVLLDLVYRVEESHVSRRVDFDELVAGRDADRVERVIARLTDEHARLLTAESEAARPRHRLVGISHEALLRSWKRLKQWLVKYRVDIDTRHRLDAAASEWDTNGRDPSYLYRDTQLAVAEEWAESHAEEMAAALRREFLEASLAARRQAERRRRRRVLGLAGLSAAATLAAVLAGCQYLEARDALERTRAASLAARAEAVGYARPDRGLLYALEAWRLVQANRQRLPAAESAVRRNLVRSGTPLSEADECVLDAVIAQGRVVVASGTSGPEPGLFVRTYELPEKDLDPLGLDLGKETPIENRAFRLTTPDPHRQSAPILSGVFSPDGLYLAVKPLNKEVTVFSFDPLLTEKTDEVQISGTRDVLPALALAGEECRTLRLRRRDPEDATLFWDLRTGRRVTEPAASECDTARPKDRTGVLGRDPSIVGARGEAEGWRVTWSACGAARLWSRPPRPGADAGEPEASPDLAVRAEGPEGWGRRWEATAVAGEPVILRDRDSGGKGFELLSHEGPGILLAFSPKGRWLATASSQDAERLYDLTKIPNKDPTKVGSEKVQALAFGPDGRWLVVLTVSGGVLLHDLSAGAEADELALGSLEGKGTAAAFSDGHLLAVGDEPGEVWVWDLEALATEPEVRDGVFFDEVGEPVASLQFKDGKLWVNGRGSRRRTLCPDRLQELACVAAGRSLSLDEWNQELGWIPYHPTCPKNPAPP